MYGDAVVTLRCFQGDVPGPYIGEHAFGIAVQWRPKTASPADLDVKTVADLERNMTNRLTGR